MADTCVIVWKILSHGQPFPTSPPNSNGSPLLCEGQNEWSWGLIRGPFSSRFAPLPPVPHHSSSGTWFLSSVSQLVFNLLNFPELPLPTPHFSWPHLHLYSINISDFLCLVESFSSYEFSAVLLFQFLNYILVSPGFILPAAAQCGWDDSFGLTITSMISSFLPQSIYVISHWMN